jgi:DNA topoisomerase II
MLGAQSERLSEQARFILMKINNEIHIENKRKAAIIEQLVKHKFKPDPVRRWKEEQRKRELQARGDAILEEEEEEEDDEQGEEAGAGRREVPKKEDDALSKRVADYDYLVGMAIWKLSTEDKDRLLEESEAKKTELQTLKRKSWDDLWEEDLAAFLIALDKQVGSLSVVCWWSHVLSPSRFRRRRSWRTSRRCWIWLRRNWLRVGKARRARLSRRRSLRAWR